MRTWIAFFTMIVVVACSDPTPTSRIVGSASLVADAQSELVPPVVFNTQLRSELESPACTSESKGLAQIMVLQDGTIEALAILNNKGDETVRFGHIHHRLSGHTSPPATSRCGTKGCSVPTRTSRRKHKRSPSCSATPAISTSISIRTSARLGLRAGSCPERVTGLRVSRQAEHGNRRSRRAAR